jgi:large subunit ribosomal protein L30
MVKKTPSAKKLRVTWERSAIGYSVKHKATIKALGLRRLHQVVELVDSPGVRGMLIKVNHLVKIEEIQ